MNDKLKQIIKEEIEKVLKEQVAGTQPAATSIEPKQTTQSVVSSSPYFTNFKNKSGAFDALKADFIAMSKKNPSQLATGFLVPLLKELGVDKETLRNTLSKM